MTNMTIGIEDIEPNLAQPRKDFDPDKLQELADNIKVVGLKQPLIVRPVLIDEEKKKKKKFQLVDGERRYRACKIIGLEEVPAEIWEDMKTEEDAAIQSFIINDQRSGYTPQDKEAYIHHLYTATGLSTRKLAAKLGVHHSAIDHYLEAYRFRKKLPPTLVGTLPLAHSALKQTAFIKDDNLRIRILQMLADGKIKPGAIREDVAILEKIPADREEVFEAYSSGMLTSSQIQSLLEGAPLGKDILINPQRNRARIFTGRIPPHVKRRILYALKESHEKPTIKWTLDYQQKLLEKWLSEEPDKTKLEEIRRSHQLQTYDTPDEIHEFFRHYSIDAIQQEHNNNESNISSEDKKEIWRATLWWLSGFHEHQEKIRQIQSEELAIAVLDLVTEGLHWEALKRSIDKEEEAKGEENSEDATHNL